MQDIWGELGLQEMPDSYDTDSNCSGGWSGGRGGACGDWVSQSTHFVTTKTEMPTNNKSHPRTGATLYATQSTRIHRRTDGHRHTASENTKIRHQCRHACTCAHTQTQQLMLLPTGKHQPTPPTCTQHTCTHTHTHEHTGGVWLMFPDFTPLT